MNQMNKRKIEIIVILTIVMVALIVKSISYKSFLDYEGTILAQQNGHILTIAKTTSRNLELYIIEKEKEIENLVENILLKKIDQGNQMKLQKELELFLQFQKEASEVSYLNLDGEIIAYVSKNIVDKPKSIKVKKVKKNFEVVKNERKMHIIEAKKGAAEKPNLYLYYPVIRKGELEGIILCEISLAKLYEKIIKPIDTGKRGYITVKSSSGTVLMHPKEWSIGSKALDLKEKIYFNLEIWEVEELVAAQLKGEEGTYIGSTYFWTKDKEKDMYAFAPSRSGERFWIVSVVMPYNEISDSIKNYFTSSLILSFIVITVLAWTLSLLIRMIKNKEAYRMERSYLKELNETTEKLRKKEMELQHKKKIELIGTLTGGIAREFNNILTPIKKYSEKILDSVGVDSDLGEDVKIIYDSSKRSQEIIDQLLTNSGDKSNENYKIISIDKFIEESKKLIETLIPKECNFNISITKEEKFVSGNETQLHQVIINLVKNSVNAMKESEKKEINLCIFKDLGEEGEEVVIIKVTDTGCGMTEEIVENIFTPFYTKKLSKNSTGLGLYVAEEIIHNHRGTIEVSSEVGRGSEFKLEFPSIIKSDENNKNDKV